MAQSSIETGKTPAFEEFKNLSADSDRRVENTLSLLNRLLANLESGPERAKAIKVLHDLSDALQEESLPHLSLRAVDVPGLDNPVKLLLTPAVFSPEMWGQTFAEGLMKNPEQFDSSRVVELGCGCGWISLLLLKKTNVKEVYGLDINPVAVTTARLNAWLNGTRPDGSIVTSQAGVPIVGAFKVMQSDLLSDCINDQEEFDHIIGCIPQVLHPEKDSDAISDSKLQERDLYDLSNYCFEQGILEDRFGLPLIARALEQSQLCLKRGGTVTLILGGRPGPDAIEQMFKRRGFKSQIAWSRRIPQADDTDLASLVNIEVDHGIKFHFFMTNNSSQSISAESAVQLLRAGKDIYHDLIVYQAKTRFEGPTFQFVQNLHKMGLDSLRKELDFSRMTEEQMSFLARLSDDFIKRKTVPYPNERGDIELRSKLSDFLRIYCQVNISAEMLFVAPERGQLLSMICNMVVPDGNSVLLSESLRDVYSLLPKNADVKMTWCNNDLAEILEMDEVTAPSIVVLSPIQFQNPSTINLKALFDHARAHPDRWYIVDDSAQFNIGSQIDANMMLRLTSEMDMPPNVILLYGLIKNIVCPDLELSFLVNAPEKWIKGLDVACELTYSRIPYPSQLYYEWLFDDLLSFPFPLETAEQTQTVETADIQFTEEFEVASSDPTFAPKPVSSATPGLIRLDYGEFEYPVPDLLIKGLIKGFVEPQSEALVETVKNRAASYIAYTRNAMVVPDRIAIAQGAFPIFGAVIRSLKERLGRAPIVAIPDGSYGPLYPMVAYHGGQVEQIETLPDKGYLFTAEHLNKLDRKPDLLWLTQPTNPGGYFLESSDIKQILQICVEQDIYMIADELFFLLSDINLGDWTPYSLSFGSKLIDSQCGDKIFVVDGMSKSYAAGGLRCGFIVCPDHNWASQIQSRLNTPPGAILRAWDNVYSAFLEEAPHGMLDVEQARQELLDYLLVARKMLASNREELESLLRKYELDIGLETRYKGGLFLVGKLAKYREALAKEEALLINSSEWSRTSEQFARLCFSIPEDRFKEALTRLSRFLKTNCS